MTAEQFFHSTYKIAFVRKTFYDKFDIKIYAFEFKSIELVTGDTAFSAGRRKLAAENEANLINQLKNSLSGLNRDLGFDSHMRMSSPAELDTNLPSFVPRTYPDQKGRQRVQRR